MRQTGGGKGRRKPITGDYPCVKTVYRNHKLSVEQICKTLDIARATFYRYIAVANELTLAL